MEHYLSLTESFTILSFVKRLQFRVIMRHLCDVVETLAQQSPNGCWVKLLQNDIQQDSIRDVTWSSLQKAVDNISTLMEDAIEEENSRSVLAYLANSDVRCAAAIIAAIKTGTKLLLLSSRNSVDINLELLGATKCKNVLYGSEYGKEVDKMSNCLQGLRCYKLKSFQDYFENETRDRKLKSSSRVPGHEETALILHSSGTTGRPKPIQITYGALAHMDRISEMPSPEGRTNKYSLMFSTKTMAGALPFFHVMGLVLLARSIYAQGPLILLPQNKPPTAQSMIAAIRTSKPSAAILVPSMLEEICDAPEGQDALSSLAEVWYGGGPLAHAYGDKISDMTMVLCGYGSTEMMTVFTLLPQDNKNWEYLEWHPDVGVIMERMTDTTSEMVIKKKENSEWQSVFYNFPNVDEWRSEDLFERHPSNDSLWRHVGRKDDMIVLSNGEKVNPCNIEGSITQHPIVKDAFLFGSGRFQVGIVLELEDKEPQRQGNDDPIAKVWPIVEETNKGLAGHAKILKSMIIIANAEKPFKRSLKGSVNRRATFELYETEIEQLYNGEQSQCGKQPSHSPADSDCSHLKNRVVESVKSILQSQEDLPVDQDLFEIGLDSLMATDLARKIQNSSLECSVETIYKYPTIEKLVRVLAQASNTNTNSTSSEQRDYPKPSREETMSRLINKYTQSIEEKFKLHRTNKSTVVLTGSTGHLGSYILASLLERKEISKIYCFNRSGDAKDKQVNRFRDFGLDVDGLVGQNVEFVHCTFELNRLGLSASKSDEIQQVMNYFIHCAWPVDFNRGLDTFEKTAISQMACCIDFVAGAAKAPTFVFISSIASVGNWAALQGKKDDSYCVVPETHLTDNSVPLRQGYAESKHVGSCILANVARTRGVSASVIRVGQLCGPRKGPAKWKETEWFPMMVKSSVALQKLPSSLGNHSIDWVPIDIAASTVVDISTSQDRSLSLITNKYQDDPLRYYNLVNPCIAKWEDLSKAIQRYYQTLEEPNNVTLESVDLGSWIREVENAAAAGPDQAKQLPASKLLGFFQNLNTKSKNTLRFALENAMQDSPPLEGLEEVGKEDMKRWLASWDFKPSIH